MFNKETEYALRAMVYVQVQNFKDRKPGVIEIAKEIDAPEAYSAKILQRLVKGGLLESAKGKGGGFFFDVNKPNLPIKSVVEATEGSKTVSGCGFGLKHCDSENPCPLHNDFAPIRAALNDLLVNETIQSLALKITNNGDLPAQFAYLK